MGIRESLHEKREAIERLATRHGARVEVVTEEGLSPLIRNRVLREAQPL